MQQDDQNRANVNRSLWAAALIGIGVMAAIDQVVFHQLLRWHHFFDLSTPAIGIVSDGFLHAAELIAIVAGTFLVLDLSRKDALAIDWAWAGFFFGMGGFQLFDGIINHKVLAIHQIRYGVSILPYDLVWNLSALGFIFIGTLLWRRAKTADSKSAAVSHR